jgi:hypothetical protein
MKVGVDFSNDGKCFFEIIGNPLQNFRCVGLMTRYANAHLYTRPGFGPLSLQTCVKELTGKDLDKDARKSKWKTREELTVSQKICKGFYYSFQYILLNKYLDAALDAQASLETYLLAAAAITRRENINNAPMPKYWFSYDLRGGEKTMRQPNRQGLYLSWQVHHPWYRSNVFEGYYV